MVSKKDGVRRKHLTSHRVLTSKKQQQAEKKNEELEAKEKRKKEREDKKKGKGKGVKFPGKRKFQPKPKKVASAACFICKKKADDETENVVFTCADCNRKYHQQCVPMFMLDHVSAVLGREMFLCHLCQ